MTESYNLTDAVTGKTMSGDFDPNDPYTFFTPAGRAAENSGNEASVPGWKESRYFDEKAHYDAFKQSGQSLEDYFASDAYAQTSEGKWWDALSQDEKERFIYEAGQRIQHTYGVQGDIGHEGGAQTYTTAIGRARFEAEKRLGKEPGSLY